MLERFHKDHDLVILHCKLGPNADARLPGKQVNCEWPHEELEWSLPNANEWRSDTIEYTSSRMLVRGPKQVSHFGELL